jgi:hypothetical protein
MAGRTPEALRTAQETVTGAERRAQELARQYADAFNRVIDAEGAVLVRLSDQEAKLRRQLQAATVCGDRGSGHLPQGVRLLAHQARRNGVVTDPFDELTADLDDVADAALDAAERDLEDELIRALVNMFEIHQFLVGEIIAGRPIPPEIRQLIHDME